MQLSINKEFEIDSPINKVWDFLIDPTKVVVCLPGASLTEKIDDDNFKGMVEVKIGPITTKYNGEVTISLRDQDNFNFKIDGKGVDSKGQGSATMQMSGSLVKNETGQTAVKNTMTVSMTGKVAQLGSRMIKAVSDQMFEDFKKNLIATLESEEDMDELEMQESKPIKAIPLMFKVMWNTIKSPFRRSKKSE